ncbi:hypothetical protein EVAR_51656_1 [Eumeta japonica]|uniref:Uncharacterized protein n=1 Tax=Eumeta variegata TaxID=151549 RepID=A0A4C1YDS6_EUMVA|nr:hypothetical protein EVAR_51656_1 [Eumeta japonica]
MEFSAALPGLDSCCVLSASMLRPSVQQRPAGGGAELEGGGGAIESLTYVSGLGESPFAYKKRIVCKWMQSYDAGGCNGSAAAPIAASSIFFNTLQECVACAQRAASRND